MRKTTFLFVSAVMVAGLAAVPQAQAVIVDLTGANVASRQGSIGNAFFIWIDAQSTGTGVIDPFVRIQNNGMERGFNTDLRPLTSPDLDDVNSSAQFTKSILVNEFGVVDLNGTPSIRFVLDINQIGGNSSNLSLDELKIYVADSPNIGTYAALGAETLVYDMDMAGDNWVKLDASLNSGSGSGDMLAYLPTSIFAGYQNKYLYLHSKFGVNHASNDGFEEWARIDGTPDSPIPEPTTIALLGMGLAGALARRRRRSA